LGLWPVGLDLIWVMFSKWVCINGVVLGFFYGFWTGFFKAYTGRFGAILLENLVGFYEFKCCFWLVYKGRNHIVVLFQVSERPGLRI
jgi:hypothetical protein